MENEIFFEICDELDAIAIPLFEAISLLSILLAEVKMDHPIFTRVKMIHYQLDRTLNTIADIHQTAWVMLYYDRYSNTVH